MDDSIAAGIEEIVTHLAVPDTIEELSEIAGRVTAPAWVGIGRDQGSTIDDFRTLTNTPFPKTSSMWSGGQPDNVGGEEYVVHIDGVRLNDRRPSITLGYICECDGVAPQGFALP